MMKERFWLEVRVPQGKKPRRGNMGALVDLAFNRGETVEFVVAGTESPERELDRIVVRWFFGFESEQTRSIARTHLETEGFYIIEGSSPATAPESGCPPDFESNYSFAAEVEATKHFAHGFLPRAGEPKEEQTFEDCPPVADRIASVISRGGALRAVFRRDDGAITEAIHVARGERGAEEGPPVDGFVSGLFRSFVSFGMRGGGEGRTETRSSGEREMSERERRMRSRADAGLFSLGIRIYGTPQQVDSVVDSLPFTPTTFRVYKSGPINEEGEEAQPAPEVGTKRWRRTAKKWSHLLIPAGLALALWYTGLWFPLKSLESFQNLLPVIAIAVSAVLPAFIRFKNPIVFSYDELTLFVSLPREMSKVPHEPGTEAEPVRWEGGGENGE